MGKTLTIRIDDETYEIFKRVAQKERRNLSNFIENATMEYIESKEYVSDEEMSEIIQEASKIKKSIKEVKEGKYKIVK